jgi:benzodiazapine receptor
MRPECARLKLKKKELRRIKNRQTSDLLLALSFSKGYNESMKIKNVLKLIIAVVICELAGSIGSIFTTPAISGWYAMLQKPLLNPPNWVFGPVWITLYALMGISLYLVSKNNWQVKNHILEGGQRTWNYLSERFWTGSWQKQNVIAIFSIQILLNILWSFVFFGLKLPSVAFFEILALWIAILYTIINFYRISKAAAYLLLPYIIWVSFATYLNYMLWILN